MWGPGWGYQEQKSVENGCSGLITAISEMSAATEYGSKILKPQIKIVSLDVKVSGF